MDVVSFARMEDDWLRRAACKGEPTALWFPDRSHDDTPYGVCAVCPVTAQCYEVSERYGIWGGLSERARRSRRRKEKIAARKAS